MVLAPGGRLWFVEVKAPGRRPSRLQQREHDRLRALGFEVLVIDSKAAVEAFADGL
jgi:predicted methyltransferase